MMTSRQKAFTLIELLLAVTIMALISIAVFSVFKVATDTYKTGNEESTIIQRGRYALDNFETDLMAIYYLPETAYDVRAREEIEEYQTLFLQAERENDWKEFEEKYGPNDPQKERDEPPYQGNPFENNRLMDLQFLGEDNGETDSVIFSRHLTFEPGGYYFPLGISRVQYQVEGDFLIRSEESVFAPPRTYEGELLEKEEPPRHVILAEGVQEFNISYGFWIDFTWFEIDMWDSTKKQLRNPDFLLGDYDDEIDDGISSPATGGRPSFGSEGWNDSLNDEDSEPYDALPTYVRVSLKLSDPDTPEKTTAFTRLYRVPGAVEFWRPTEELDEDDRDEELDIRKDDYIEVQPGALRKS